MSARLDAMVRATDHLRGSAAALGGAAGHKEWFHFNVAAPGFDALLNFSLVDDVGPDGDVRRVLPRVTWLLHDAKGWRGEVLAVDCDDVDARSGSVGLRLGEHAFSYVDGAYRIAMGSTRQAVAFDLAFTPTTVPTSFHNVDLGDGPPLHWLIVPRLRASGTVTFDGVRHVLADAPAYHDHNWGHFRWGGDFAWEWGYVLSPSEAPAWSIVFSRMNDRAYHRTRRVGLMVWRGQLQHKVFFGGSIQVTRSGVHRVDHVAKFPPVMALARPGTHTSVPAEFTMEARQGNDWLRLRIQPGDVAQILVPTEDVTGLTAIHEVAAEIDVEGEIHGEALRFSTRAVVEFLGG